MLLLSVLFWILISGDVFPPDRGIPADSFTGMGNPAAVYCREMGYAYRMIQEEGGQRGICEMPDGESCPAWAFLKGECGLQYSYCSQLGLASALWDHGQGGFFDNHVVCVDDKGVEVGAAIELINLQEKSMGCSVGDVAPVSLMADDNQTGQGEMLDGDPPASFDWRNVDGGNWLTGVRNQRSCGSCWAFAAVGVAESVLNISQGDPEYDVDLSEEYLVTDALPYHDCCGGSKSYALSLIRDDGIPIESCLPYVEGDGDGCSCNDLTCDSNCTYNSSSECADRRQTDTCSSGDPEYGWHDIEEVGFVDGSSRDNIKQHLITYGPLAVSMEWEGWGGFHGDIYKCETDDSHNHAVVIVGYDDVGEYWIVRNSWGLGFDDDGYFNVGYGECWIENGVYYATDNESPNVPSTPDPEDGSSDVPVKKDLSWTGGDPNPGDAVTYDVYLEAGDDTPDVLVCDDVSTPTCDPGLLLAETQYYWKVVAADEYLETTTGPVWSLITEKLNDNPGFFLPDKDKWIFKNSQTDGWGDTLSFTFGPTAGLIKQPLTGDWNGDGVDTAGLYLPERDKWALKDNQEDGWGETVFFHFGPSAGLEKQPLAGDWDGDGEDSVGLYLPEIDKWVLKNSQTDGWDETTLSFYFGPAMGLEKIPLTGDWDGDGVDTVGFYLPEKDKWILKNSHTDGWDGTTFGFHFGPAPGLEKIPLSGDWDENGVDTVGFYLPEKDKWILKNSQTDGWVDTLTFHFGPTQGLEKMLLTGDWE